MLKGAACENGIANQLVVTGAESGKQLAIGAFTPQATSARDVCTPTDLSVVDEPTGRQQLLGVGGDSPLTFRQASYTSSRQETITRTLRRRPATYVSRTTHVHMPGFLQNTITTRQSSVLVSPTSNTHNARTTINTSCPSAASAFASLPACRRCPPNAMLHAP